MGEISSMFIGIGGMTLLLVISYLFYQFTRIWKGIADLDEMENCFEMTMINRVAKTKGIDLKKEIEKDRIFKANKHNFRRRLRQEMYEELFGKDEKKD